MTHAPEPARPDVPPQSADGCPTCRELDRAESSAVAARDLSGAVDCRVLRRRHRSSAHGAAVAAAVVVHDGQVLPVRRRE